MSSRLLDLPTELLAAVLSHLEREDLREINLTSKACHTLATPLIWKHVDLVDCRAHTSITGNRTVTHGPGSASHQGRGIPAGASVGGDEHDDTPLIKKLIVLASQPWIAASVESVTHRCHLTAPNIFIELPRTPFSSQTLSMDPRTICLVRLAVRNMTRVNTLRIVFGHPKLTEALLRCFFDEKRQKEHPVKRLWLENVRIVEGTEITLDRHKYELPLRLNFGGVETVRLRRLPLASTEMPQVDRVNNRSLFVYSRGGNAQELQNGLGGSYLTSTNTVGAEVVRGHEQLEQSLDETDHSLGISPLEKLMYSANRFDDDIYAALSEEVKLPAEVAAAHIPSYYWRSLQAYRDHWPGPVTELSPEGSRIFRKIFRTELPSAAQCAITLFRDVASTLTSLTIDWAMSVPPSYPILKQSEYEGWIRWYSDLFSLRCPHLRAFQYRNAVARESILPPGLFLFDRTTVLTGDEWEQSMEPPIDPNPNLQLGLKPLEFMEAHPNLQCLAWPVHNFFSPDPKIDIVPRVRTVIEKLGQKLVDLRVDCLYTGMVEPHSEDDTLVGNYATTVMHRRRRFVAEFAAEMRVLQSIKIEGSLPLDERRETIAALHHCPIEKLVFIGVASVIGNTWGANGNKYRELLANEDMEGLEGEDEATINSLGSRPLMPFTAKNTFEPSYGWLGRPPVLHTIASHHSSSIRELKFCGYKGAINLYDPDPIAKPLLAALKHCHALESLIMSFWLSTMFEGHTRDDEVISYWLNTRDSSSTSLVSLCDESEEGSWAHELKTKFAPKALAWEVVRVLGPYLSETAKKRKGGVHVRASFCVGDWGGVFDIEVSVGKGSVGSDVCLGFEGPREEMDDGKRREKLERRRWF